MKNNKIYPWIQFVLALLVFLFACFLVSQSQNTKEIWEIKTKVYESDTIFTKNGEVKKIYEITDYDWSPIILKDTIRSSERLNKFAGFVWVENQTIAKLAEKYDLPTEREVNAMLKSEYMAEILGKTDLIIFLSNFAQDNEVWTRKETTVQAILPKSSFIQEEYQKHTDPRDGYTRIIEKHRKWYDSCMMRIYNKRGIITQGHMEGNTQISGWIFITSPKEVY